MEAKVFVDEYGRVIADESGSEVAYFVAQSALGENAVNQGQYRLVYVDEITLLDTTYTSNISSMKNYIFNEREQYRGKQQLYHYQESRKYQNGEKGRSAGELRSIRTGN